MATWRLVQAAERAGVQRFVFFSTLGASTRSRARLMRAKAVAEQAVRASSLDHTVFAPSIVYSPGDPWLTLLARLSWLPVMPIPGAGDAAFQPIWAEDVAGCVMAALAGGRAPGGGRPALRAGRPRDPHPPGARGAALRSFRRRRRVVGVPTADRAPPARPHRAVRRPDGVCHLGRGRAARGPSDRRRWDRRRGGPGGLSAVDAGGARPDLSRSVPPGHPARAPPPPAATLRSIWPTGDGISTAATHGRRRGSQVQSLIRPRPSLRPAATAAAHATERGFQLGRQREQHILARG